MPGTDNCLVRVDIKNPLGDILVQSHEVSLRRRLSYAAREERIANEKVRYAIDLNGNRGATGGMAPEYEDGELVPGEGKGVAVLQFDVDRRR